MLYQLSYTRVSGRESRVVSREHRYNLAAEPHRRHLMTLDP